MNEKIKIQTLKESLFEKKILLILSGILGASQLLMMTFLFSSTDKTIILPAHLSKSVWIKGDEVSKTYIEEMALYYSHLLLDIDPNSYKFQAETISRYTDPRFYQSLKKMLIDNEEKFTKQGIMTRFKPIEVNVDPTSNETVIIGDLSTYVGSQKIKQERLSYRMNFRFVEPNLFLKNFEEIEKLTHEGGMK